MRSKLKALFRKKSDKKYSFNAVHRDLGKKTSKRKLDEELSKLVEEGYLFMPDNNSYRLEKNHKKSGEGNRRKKNTGKGLEGIVDRTKSGSAYIVLDQGDSDDVFVPEKKLASALHGDRVRISVKKGRRGRKNGEVQEVLRRKTETFVGQFHKYKNRSLVEGSDGKVTFDILVDATHSLDAANGDMVTVRVHNWPSNRRQQAIGKITAVLGKAGSNDAEMDAIFYRHGFDINFPKEVQGESEKLRAEITEKALKKRRDMRGTRTFTIDPDTAKDFDDALSIEFLDDGSYEIGIHIADVTHFVREGTALDKEALERSTSVYLVDRVCPMLPERLSNELCSLRPNEDKYTFSAVFTFDKSHQLDKRWFGKTVTHSDRRFTYEEAQEIIDNGEGDFAHELRFLNGESKRLRKQRYKNGSINFETEEVKFVLDEDGHPIDIVVKERKDTHMLVEDFMLLANREVATFIVKKDARAAEIPFVYRIHDKPDMDRIQDFVNFAAEMGYHFDIQNPRQIVKAFNKLSSHVHQNEAFKILQPLAIRTMAKAVYSTENIGHFGLGFDNYTHFTSPIRRYADVLVHRVLYNTLDKSKRFAKDNLETMAKHISAQEKRAMEAERESVKYKQVEFLKDRIGKEFSGIVSGMIDKGFFVELLGSLAEGMVIFSELSEPFKREESGLKAVGRNSGDVIKLGTKVRVIIKDVNMQRREVEMELIKIEK